MRTERGEIKGSEQLYSFIQIILKSPVMLGRLEQSQNRKF